MVKFLLPPLVSAHSVTAAVTMRARRKKPDGRGANAVSKILFECGTVEF